MPRFRYTAFSIDGRRDEGVVDFATEMQAWDSLTGLGLTVVALAPAENAKSKVAVRNVFFSSDIPLGVQADVAEQLSVLTLASLQMTEVVAMIARSSTHVGVRRAFEKVGRLQADGVTFDKAFEQAASGFSPLFIAMVGISQTTPEPGAVLRNLAAYLRRQQRLQSQFKGALIYPLILLSGGISVFLLMVLYLAPSLQPMFVSLGRDPPGAIGVFFAIGAGLRAYGVQLGLSLVLLIFICLIALRNNVTGNRALALRLPVIGAILRDGALARLTRSLNLMLAANIPLSVALRDTGTYLKADIFATDFLRAAAALESGDRASSVFRGVPLLPVMFRELFEIGEKSNSLVNVTESIAKVLEDSVEREGEKAVQLVTPLLTLVMGGGLALLVYSIMDAILSVNDLAF